MVGATGGRKEGRAMKAVLNRSHQGRSGNVALLVFLAVYAASLAIVIAPVQVTATADHIQSGTFD